LPFGKDDIRLHELLKIACMLDVRVSNLLE
jgi:hypothetical protein